MWSTNLKEAALDNYRFKLMHIYAITREAADQDIVYEFTMTKMILWLL